MNMVNEEINKIKYLFEYKKGVVISEQAVPPPPTTGTTGTTTSTTGETTTQTTTTPQKVDLDKLRDCAGFKSGGKLTKGEEKDDFIVFNNEKGIPVCKKPKEKSINENIGDISLEDMEIGDEFSVEPHVRKQPREKQIEKMFGKYDEQIPNDVLRYMRKNPQLMMDRLARVYGEKFLDYAERAYIKYMDSKKTP